MIMPRLRDRKCAGCGKLEYNTATRSEYCVLCANANKRAELIKNDPVFFAQHGYTIVSGPTWDKFNHRCYRVLTPCGHEWEAPFTNMLKQIKNAQSKNLRPACGVCGPKHRMKVALDGFMDKYARDYDLQQYQDYVKKVRTLSDTNYRQNKQLINPNNLKRGRHHYHLDHKMPIIECFKQGWSVERASSICNLQMLESRENLKKGTSIPDTLFL